MNDYKKINKIAWDIKTGIHINSEFYNNKSFLKGESSLKHVELDLLGDIKGKSILHLQCHFGQDTISLARLGANVTGIDISGKAIDYAKTMSKELNIDVKFICSDIYELPNVLDEKFDIVFTSYGVVGWLPDMEQWAKVISHHLKPTGRFIMIEFHPVVWMFDDDFRTIDYSYFKAGEIIEQLQGTYANRNSGVQYSTVTWNHSLSDILNNLIRANIQINRFEEYDYSPQNCFKHTVEIDRDKYRIKHLDDKLPMIYAIEGIKN